jgi:hypothetical protein
LCPSLTNSFRWVHRCFAREILCKYLSLILKFKSFAILSDIWAQSVLFPPSAASLEKSYLTYSHRQRQKSLIIVNAVDLVLKFVLAAVYFVQRKHDVSAWKRQKQPLNLNIFFM